MHNLGINIFISFSILFVVNFILSKNKILIDNPNLSQHKSKHNKIIPLSGGIFFILTYLIISFLMNLDKLILIYFAPFLIIGIIADLKENFSPKLRLFLQTTFLIIFIIIFDLKISSIDLKFFDFFLENYYFNFFFVLFCLITILNGYNFMDGLNGLVSGQMMLITLSIYLISILYNLDYLNSFNQLIELFLSISLIFFLFNIFGLCYLGDNGIYVFSLFLSLLVISFIENSQGKVSPLVAAIFFWYPAFENLFTIIRRIKNNQPISKPDVLHLHSLLKNFIFKNLKKKITKSKLNSLAGITINIFLIPNFFLGIFWYNNSTKLLILIIFQIIIYMVTYSILVKKYN